MITGTYKEICTMLSDLEFIQFMDIWRNQISFFSEELPFSTPALFFEFRSVTIKDMAQGSQSADMQMKVRYYDESLNETYHGSSSQIAGLQFGERLDRIHAVLHGSSGLTFSSMSRRGFQSEDSSSAAYYYSMIYQYKQVDNTATKAVANTTASNIEFTKGTKDITEEEGMFYLNL